MNRTLKAILVSAGLCTLPSLCFSAVVYDNTQNNLNLRYAPPTPTLEFGDQIILAGTDRTLSLFEFEYFFIGTPDITKTWTLRLYANDLGANNAPGTVLFAGDAQTVGAGGNAASITFPAGVDVIVPNTFTWSVEFSNLAAGDTGNLLVYGPPNVGSSFNDFWQKDGAGAWSLMQIVGASDSSFLARITAVPEPGVLALGGIGALLLVGLRRLHKAPR